MQGNRRARHPRGLYVLFLTEMWERFSYYGMRALLVLYLVNGIDMARHDALQVYATYTAFVYLTPILGGYVADRWLGARRAVLVGGLLMAAGHFSMALPPLLDLALVLLVLGNGFFKPNISTLVGGLYGPDDPRRDGGFTLFYMGINLGAFLAPLVCGTLGEKFGWHWGFAAAGVGMLLAVGVFTAGHASLRHRGRAGRRLRPADWWLVLSLTAGLLLFAATGVYGWRHVHDTWVGLPLWLRGLILFALIAAVVAQGQLSAARARLGPREWRHILAILLLGGFVVFFWMGFEQAGGTMNLFALQHTDRMLFDWEMPASYFQALNPLLILLLAPAFSVLFVQLDRSRFALSAPTKMAIGMILLGLGFVVLALAAERAQAVGRVSPLWLVVVYLLHTIGELFLSPIGLSMVSRLAPAQLVSLMMGMWFTAVAVANYLAGTLEALLQGSGIPLYWFLVSSSIGAGLVLLLCTPLLRWLMR